MRRWVGTAAIGAVIGGLVAGMIAGEGDRSGALELGSGAAWFGTATAGTAALIDGSTGTRVTRRPVAAAGARFEVVQSGSAALIVNTDDGTVRRVDGASWAVSEPVKVGSPGDADFAVHTGGATAWAVTQRGTVVQQLDPVRLTTIGAPQTVPGTISGIAVGADGTLWVTNSAGEVQSYRDGVPQTATKVSGLSAATVVFAADTPVVVDVGQRIAQLLDPTTGEPTRRSCLDITDAAGPTLALGTKSSPWLLAVAPSAATLLVSRTDTGICQPIALGDTSTDPRYGRPVEKNGLVFVPDFVAGTVIVVDPEQPPGSQVVRRVDIGLPKSAVDLLVHNDFVWFDEPGGDHAGVIGDDLTASLVSKNSGDEQGSTPQRPQEDPDSQQPAAISCSHDATALPGQSVKVNAFATDPTVQVDDWTWSFDGGTPSSGSGPQSASTFPEGTHAISVTATVAGAQVEARCPIIVTNDPPPTNPPNTVPSSNPDPNPNVTTTTKPGGGGGSGAALTPTFSVAPNPGKAGQPVTFTDTTAGAHSGVAWTFAGGAPATATTPKAVVTWSSPGTYQVTLTVTGPAGAKTAQQNVTINPPDQVSVPDLTNQPEAAAKALLNGLGLTSGATTQANSLLAVGNVVSTTPPKGSSVLLGSKVDLVVSNGIGSVSLVAGNGAQGSTGDGGPAVGAQLTYPRAAASDLAGNTYFFEEGSCRIRRIDPFGGISTVAGAAGCQALGGTASTPAPASAAPIDDLRDLAVDAAGNVYTLETENSFARLVRRIGTDGVISEFFRGYFKLPAPMPDFQASGIAIAPSGDLYMTGSRSDMSNPGGGVDPVIVRYSGGAASVVFDPGLSFYVPSALAVNQAGDVVYYDGTNNNVMIWTAASGNIAVLARSGPGGNDGDGGPATAANMNCANAGCDFAFDGRGGLLIADGGNNRIRRVDLATGTINAWAGTGAPGAAGNGGPAPAATFNYPNDISLAPDGSIIVSDSQNYQIRRIS